MVEPTAAEVGALAATPSIVLIALGVVLLLFGRRLFWLLVGAVGFAVGFVAADTYLPVDGEALRWAVGLGAGLVAGFAAILLQRLAVSITGALVAGYCAFWYMSLAGAPLETWQWLLVALAAVAGLLVARGIFDLALIVLSSLAGATLALEGVGGEPEVSRWLFFALVVVGVAVQAWTRPDQAE